MAKMHMDQKKMKAMNLQDSGLTLNVTLLDSFSSSRSVVVLLSRWTDTPLWDPSKKETAHFGMQCNSFVPSEWAGSDWEIAP